MTALFATLALLGSIQSVDSAGALPAGSAFVENRGQWPIPAEFVARVPGGVVRVRPDELWLQFFSDPRQGHVVRLVFEGASPDRRLESAAPRPERLHYFKGRDPQGWHRNVRVHEELRCRGLYEGVDLVMRVGAAGFKYDLQVHPGADLGQVRVRCEGIDGLSFDGDGSLVFETSSGSLRQPSAETWRVAAGGDRVPVACRYRRIDDRRFGFEVAQARSSLPLIVDPLLVWSTYLGSSANPLGVGDGGSACALSANGDLTVVGVTADVDFPMTPGTYQHTSQVGYDTFVARFSGADGALMYSSVIGGSVFNGGEKARAVAVDALGRATVAGFTGSADFPTTPGSYLPDAPYGAFVLRLSPSGDDLEYSTYLGGPGGALAHAVAVTADGSAIVGGQTGVQQDLPATPGAFDETHNGGVDGFLARFDPTGSSLTWATYVGGSTSDFVWDLAVNASGEVTACGVTSSSNGFPTTPGSLQPTWPGPPSGTSNGFVLRLSSDGGSLLWSTFLGGTSNEDARALAVDPTGGVIVAGETLSQDFPVTPGAFQPLRNTTNHFSDAFVSHLDSTGCCLLASTYLGSSFRDTAEGVALDARGRPVVAGITYGNDFPVTTNGYDATWNGSTDSFLTVVSSDGTELVSSSYVGGISHDDCYDLAGEGGRVAMVGTVFGPGYPTTPGSHSPSFNGGQSDAFATTFFLPETDTPATSSVPRSGPPRVHASRIDLGDGKLAIRAVCVSAPVLAVGFAELALTPSPDEASLAWPSSGTVATLQADADDEGTARASFEVPTANGSATALVRFLFRRPDGSTLTSLVASVELR